SMFDTFKRGDWSSKGACSRCRADDAGEIVRLVDGLTSDVKSSLRRFPANSFRSAASTRRNPDGGIVADPEAPDSVLVYGPYVRAQPGRYRVYHDLRVLTASATCAIELDVCVGYRKTIARKRINVSKEPLAKFIERGEFSLCSRGRSGRRSGRRGPELRDAEYLIDRECH